MHDPCKTVSGVQNSGPWDPWLPVVEHRRLFAQRAQSAWCAPCSDVLFLGYLWVSFVVCNSFELLPRLQSLSGFVLHKDHFLRMNYFRMPHPLPCPGAAVFPTISHFPLRRLHSCQIAPSCPRTRAPNAPPLLNCALPSTTTHCKPCFVAPAALCTSQLRQQSFWALYEGASLP